VEILNNPCLEAEEWRAPVDVCSRCGAKNKDISVDDLFPDNYYSYTRYFYKCGFCSHKEEIRVPKAVSYEVNKRFVESEEKPVKKEERGFRFVISSHFLVLLLFFTLLGLGAIKRNNDNLAIVMLFFSVPVALTTGALIVKEAEK
jgi:DNA-directed RNA polymerase subunit RPC12/RpoP